MILPSSGLGLALEAVGLADAGRVGRKAATLGELKQAGFPVPEGVVLTTEALARTLAAAGLGGDAQPGQVLAATLPAEVAAAIAAAAGRLGGRRLAVRSSGVDEDLAGASYAGQYESVLDVPANRLAEAVRRCWASAFTAHVVAYRRAHGGGAGAAMAVLVLPMVAAEAAGVAFSADPVTGDRATAVVSAVRGLGERLVGGQVSPDEWEVRDGTARCRAAPEGAIDAQTAVAVAALAHRVQEHFGAPQDIEWALAGGELALLQARPITALPDQAPAPVPVPVQVPPGFWQREASHAPKPLSPTLLSVLSEPRNRAIRQAFAEFGALAEGLEFQDLGGWQYTRLVPLGGKDRPPPPGWLLPLLLRVVPRLRQRVREAAAAVDTDKAGRLLQRWYAQWRPQLAGRIRVLREVDLSALDDQGLDDHTARAVRLLDDGLQVHFLLHAAVAFTLAELAFAGRELLGWSDEEVLELLTGLSTTSTRPAHRLAELACLAANRPAIAALLGHLDASTADRLAEADPEFAAAFAAYQRDFGHRALRYEVADPTIAELPELTLRLLADQVVRGYDPGAEQVMLASRRAQAADRARAALAGRPSGERERFERALARAELAYPVREEREFFTMSVPLGLLRYAALVVGRRLAARGQLGRAGDVFFLTLDEARAALRDGQDQQRLATRRAGEHVWAEQHPGPTSYGPDPGPPPPLDALPAQARFVMAAMQWTLERINEQTPSSRVQDAGAAVLHGIAASPGRYSGPVRMVLDEFQFAKLRPRDVLVCPITSPVWSVLFPTIGALVTDTGGILSHLAIIAREHRVPAVVATGNATGVLRDDQVVTVDGSAGQVQLTE